jgi:hypothetical protein
MTVHGRHREASSDINRAGERVWSVLVLVTVVERGRCFACVTRPDEGL